MKPIIWYSSTMHFYKQNKYDWKMTAINGGCFERVSLVPTNVIGGFAL